MYFVEIFFCLFCNFRGSNLPARERKTEKNKEVASLLKYNLITGTFFRIEEVYVHK
jgi:hypothetical protein